MNRRDYIYMQHDLGSTSIHWLKSEASRRANLDSRSRHVYVRDFTSHLSTRVRSWAIIPEGWIPDIDLSDWVFVNTYEPREVH